MSDKDDDTELMPGDTYSITPKGIAYLLSEVARKIENDEIDLPNAIVEIDSLLSALIDCMADEGKQL